MLNNFKRTNQILRDIQSVIDSGGLDVDHPIVSDYLARYLIITFVSEFENDFKTLISRRIGNYERFCTLCSTLRNPKFSDISKVLNTLNIGTITMADPDKEAYTAIVQDRDKIAHDPRISLQVSYSQIVKGISIGERILQQTDLLTQ